MFSAGFGRFFQTSPPGFRNDAQLFMFRLTAASSSRGDWPAHLSKAGRVAALRLTW